MIWSKKKSILLFFTGRQKPNQNVLKSNSIQIPNLSPIWSYILIGEVHRVLAQPTVNILLFFVYGAMGKDLVPRPIPASLEPGTESKDRTVCCHSMWNNSRLIKLARPHALPADHSIRNTSHRSRSSKNLV